MIESNDDLILKYNESWPTPKNMNEENFFKADVKESSTLA